jgi:predicted nucleic acid-binding protein
MLLDTDVMIDILRGHPPAVAWLASLGTTSMGLPGLVAMELLQGCQNLPDQQSLEKQLLRFTLHWPTQADCQRAYVDFAAYRLSHNLGLLDSLIGHTALGLNERLATFNLKHYGVIAGLQAFQPY